MSTPNLGIALLAESQSSKYVTVNDALDALDEALAGFSSIALSGTTLTLTTAQAMGAMVLKFTGTPGGAATVTFPQSPKVYILDNSTTGGYAVTVETGAGGSPATVSVSNGSVQLVYCDGTNFKAVS